MRNSVIDQATLEDSFFFCEYAKRRFEMSEHNDGDIEKIIDTLNDILIKTLGADVPKSLRIDFLTDVIYAHEAYKISLRPAISLVDLQDHIVFLANTPLAKSLLDITDIFEVSAAFLPFPYDMAEVAMLEKSDNRIPNTFKTLSKKNKQCVINCHNDCNYVYFGVDKNLPLAEIIDRLKKQATLFKSYKNYENCDSDEILIEIHKQSKSKTYRQSLNNVFYKSTGLLIYDLYISNKFDLESALMKHRANIPQIKCDPSKKPTSEDCVSCKYFSSCADLWRKQFNAAVEKISGTEERESYLNRIRDNAQVKLLKRQPISFFEYQFSGTVK